MNIAEGVAWHDALKNEAALFREAIEQASGIPLPQLRRKLNDPRTAFVGRAELGMQETDDAPSRPDADD